MSELLTQINAGLADAVEQAQRSLVTVHSGRRGHGAGVIWSADGVVMTNAHVVRRGRVRVTLPDGETLPAQIVGRHGEHDLAVLKVAADDLPAADIADSRAVRAGQWVLALGHPWGVRGAVTAGVVIAAGDQIAENPMPGREWIAVNLHYRPGHSGGPLVDARGRVLGFNTVMTGLNAGLAVPSHIAEDLLNTLHIQPTTVEPVLA